MKILKDISEDVVLSFGRLATMEKHLHRLAEGKASEVINTTIQTDKPSLNSLSIQTDKPSQKSLSIQTTPPKKNNQATATDYDYNIQELNAYMANGPSQTWPRKILTKFKSLQCLNLLALDMQMPGKLDLVKMS